MSYDVYLTIDTGADEPHYVEEFNYTYNCSPMFRLAIVAPDGDGEGVYALDKRPAPEAERMLANAVAYFDKHPAELCVLNPPNGWGDYHSARDWLDRIREACARHPLTTVVVS